MEDECKVWLEECLRVFPELRSHPVTAWYARMTKGQLSRLHFDQLDPLVEILARSLPGVDKKKLDKAKLQRLYRIEINSRLKKIEDTEQRKQVVRFALIHHMVQIQEVSKNEKGQATAPPHEVLRRYNKLMELEGKPKIKTIEDYQQKISHILSQLERKTARKTANKKKEKRKKKKEKKNKPREEPKKANQKLKQS